MPFLLFFSLCVHEIIDEADQLWIGWQSASGETRAETRALSFFFRLYTLFFFFACFFTFIFTSLLFMSNQVAPQGRPPIGGDKHHLHSLFLMPINVPQRTFEQLTNDLDQFATQNGVTSEQAYSTIQQAKKYRAGKYKIMGFWIHLTLSISFRSTVL